MSARAAWIGFAVLLLVYSVLTLREMSVVEATADEATYLNSGRIILREGWQKPVTRLHGPIPYYANQLFVPEPFPSGGYRVTNDRPWLLFRGRLGTLPFGWLALTLVFVWSLSVFGPLGALVSAGLLALDPLMIGYGGLLAVDMIHSATVLLALYLTWSYVVTPRRWKIPLVGVGLGVAFGTKYLALLVGPVVAITLATRCARERATRRGAVQAWLATVATVALVSVLTLHALYGFQAGFAARDPLLYSSETIRHWIDLPVLGHLLSSLPSYYLLGADYQLSLGEKDHWVSFVDGTLQSGNWSYYLRAFLWKSPEWVVILTAWLFVFRVPRWLACRGARKENATAWVLVPPLLVIGGYLSLFTSLQIGIRYVLPLFPMLFVMLGALGTLAPLRRATPRALGILAGLVLLLQAVEIGRNWPNLIGYFNTAAGGQAHAFLHFVDSNADWNQLGRTGEQVLRETEAEPFRVLTAESGPRFGRVAIKITELAPPDPEDPGRARHWLRYLPFERHVGGAWWLFDVRPAVYEAAVERYGDDERVRRDLALAYLGANRLEDARRHIAKMSREVARGLTELVDKIERLEARKGDAESVFLLARVWNDLGRYDRTERLMREEPSVQGSPRKLLVLADSLIRQERSEEALQLLELAGDPSDPQVAFLLVPLYLERDRFARAVDVLTSLAGDVPDVQAARIRQLLSDVRKDWEEHVSFWDALR